MKTRLALWLSMAAVVPLGAQSADPPGAFELLEQVRRAYGSLPAYRDLGEIRIVTAVAGQERRSSQWFTTAAGADGGFRWELITSGAHSTERRVLWRDGEAAFLYDSRRGQFRPVDSVAAELVHGFGDGGFEALAVAILAAGSGDALAEPEAASVEGPEPCDSMPGAPVGSCWILAMTRMGGTIVSELWIDRQSLLVQRVEVELASAAEVMAAATAAAGLADRRREPPDGPTRISVFHQVQPGSPDAGGLDFQPPDDARRVETWQEPAGAMVAAAGDGGALDLGFSEEITVSLFTVEARIVDRGGEPIPDLKPEDLKVMVGGEELQVAAVDWISPSSQAADAPQQTPPRMSTRLPRLSEAPLGRDETGPATDRTVMLFVQADREPLVVQGHMKILPPLRELVTGLPAGDRIAVFAYYRHLELMQDLTRDRDAVLEVLDRAFRPGAVPVPRRGERDRRRLSLRPYLDFREAEKATSPERALELAADSLKELPGDKLVIYVGWSIGHFRPREGVAPDEHYEPALRALGNLRAPVFVLDVMDAGWHALELGLQGIAEATGGTYLKTAFFPSQATRRLARTLAGYYRLTVDRGQPPLVQGRVRIRLRQHRGTVLFRPTELR